MNGQVGVLHIAADPDKTAGVAPPVVLDCRVYIKLHDDAGLHPGVGDGFAGQLAEAA